MRQSSMIWLILAMPLLFFPSGSYACTTLQSCALEAQNVLQQRIKLRQDPLLGVSLEYEDFASGLMITAGANAHSRETRQFQKSTGATWVLETFRLVSNHRFFPRDLPNQNLDFANGATIVLTAKVDDHLFTPGTEPEIFGAKTAEDGTDKLLFAFGQAALNKYFVKRRMQALGDADEVVTTLRPWDPVARPNDWVAIYLTFRPDGKLRIDQLSLIDGNWQAALLESGWPIRNLGGVDSAGTIVPPVYFDWQQFWVGRLMTATPETPLFGELLVFSRALTPEEIVGHHWYRTSLPLSIDMKPCNTGLYLNGPVSTPCGGLP